MAHMHTVEQGECLSGIAKMYGFSDWKIIYNHPQNADFKSKRPDPNILYPGDRIFIPDKLVKLVDGATEKKHVFKKMSQEAVLRLVIIVYDEPLNDTDYELEFGDQKKKGKTDANGKLETKVPVDVGNVTVKISDYILDLDVGHLNPIEENVPDDGISGIQGRLYNLGYDPGPIDGILGRRTRAALSVYQEDNELTESGNPEKQTRQKIKEEYGC